MNRRNIKTIKIKIVTYFVLLFLFKQQAFSQLQANDSIFYKTILDGVEDDLKKYDTIYKQQINDSVFIYQYKSFKDTVKIVKQKWFCLQNNRFHLYFDAQLFEKGDTLKKYINYNLNTDKCMYDLLIPEISFYYKKMKVYVYKVLDRNFSDSFSYFFFNPSCGIILQMRELVITRYKHIEILREE